MTWTGASATGSFAPSMPFALQINSARKSSGDQCSHRLGLRLIKESTFRERTLGLWGWLVIRSEVKWPSCLLPGDKQAVEDVTGLEGISLHPASPALSFKSFVHLALNTRSNNVAGGGPRSRSRAVHARRAWGEGGGCLKTRKKKDTALSRRLQSSTSGRNNSLSYGTRAVGMSRGSWTCRRINVDFLMQCLALLRPASS